MQWSSPSCCARAPDYGEREILLEDKVTRVLAQLKRGEAEIIFDPDTDSVTIQVRQKSK